MAKTMNTEAVKADVDTIRRAIRELESPKAKRDRERVSFISKVYQDIRDQLQAGVSKSAIIKKLAEHDVSLSNKLFDELLEAEAKRRGELVPGKDVGADGDVPVLANEPLYAPQTGAKEEEIK